MLRFDLLSHVDLIKSITRAILKKKNQPDPN